MHFDETVSRHGFASPVRSSSFGPTGQDEVPQPPERRSVIAARARLGRAPARFEQLRGRSGRQTVRRARAARVWSPRSQHQPRTARPLLDRAGHRPATSPASQRVWFTGEGRRVGGEAQIEAGAHPRTSPWSPNAPRASIPSRASYFEIALAQRAAVSKRSIASPRRSSPSMVSAQRTVRQA